MSAQNRATANGGNTRKSKKKRNARSQPKCDDEQKRTSGGEETTGGCAQRDGAQRDEVKIEKVRQPINKSLTSGSGAVTRALDSALTTRLDSVPSFDGENCLLCYKPRDVTSHIGGTNEDQGPLSLWLCPECRLTIEIRQQKKEPVESTRERFTTPSGVTENRDVVMPDVLTLSNGLHREIETLVPRDKDTTVMQSKWMELRHAIRCAYRQAGTSLADDRSNGSLGSSIDKLQESMKFFCSRDPHQLFERVETQAREYILEVKLRLMEKLSLGTSTVQSGRDFLRTLTEEYWSLCVAMETLVDILSPLETEYLCRVGVTVELLNKHLFYDLVFTDVTVNDAMRAVVQAMSANQDSSNSEPMLLEQFSRFEREMYRADREWRNVKLPGKGHDKGRSILQRLTERKSELGDCTGSMSSSMELSLIEKRRSKSDEPIAQNKYKQLFLSDEKERLLGRDMLDADCPGSPPSFEEHFTFMWDLYLDRERYENDMSPQFQLAQRMSLDCDDNNPIFRLMMTRKLGALSRVQQRELADEVLQKVLSRKTTLLEDTLRPRSVASDAFVYTGPVRQFVGCVDASECRCPSCAQTRCMCERCKDARKSIEYVSSTSGRTKTGKSSKSNRKKRKGAGTGGVTNQSTTLTVPKGGCSCDGLSMNGIGRFWEMKNRESVLALDSKLSFRSPCQCPACEMAREKHQHCFDTSIPETMNSMARAIESGNTGSSTNLASYTPPVSPSVAVPPSSPHPSCNDQSSEDYSSHARSSSPLPPLESQSDETSSVCSLGVDYPYNSMSDSRGVDPSFGVNPSSGMNSYSMGTNSTSSGSRSGGKHCNCYYCELFGHGQGITAPTSHNFTQVRDKLRQRLNQRKPSHQGGQEHEDGVPGHDVTDTDDKDARTVEELVSFITGDEKQGKKQQGKADKRSRQKQKKAEAKAKRSTGNKKKTLSENLNNYHEEPLNHTWDSSMEAIFKHVNGPTSIDGYAWSEQDLEHDSANDTGSTNSHTTERLSLSNGSTVMGHGEDNNYHHMAGSLDDEVPSDGIGLDDDEDSVDEFEKRLEEFRKFCFDSAPQKKKLSVNLDSLTLKKKSQKP